MPPELEEVRAWLRKADHDRRAADAVIALPNPLTDTAAFHCQQAIEKVLKAFLVCREFEFEKVHDLEKLLDDCARFESDFSALKPRVEPISAYAVRFRYPGSADPCVEEVKAALVVAGEVWEFVLARLPPAAKP